jgi:hypothetical protein
MSRAHCVLFAALEPFKDWQFNAVALATHLQQHFLETAPSD